MNNNSVLLLLFMLVVATASDATNTDRIIDRIVDRSIDHIVDHIVDHNIAHKTEALTIPAIHQAMRDGKLTSSQLTQHYLQRIVALNPKLNAVITINPKAQRDAKRADAQATQLKQQNQPWPLLLGVPVLVKDNIDTADGMANTGGSVLLKKHTPKHDAFVIQQLRQAGAVILGKANLSEWANFRSTRSNSGWSAMGGQTRNPFDITRSPCGSSSGSGVAVSANLTQVAIGTETDGSITCPSSMNGVVGIKPTIGAVSRAGIIPISSQFDTAGPMARSVTDAVFLLQAMLGRDERDTHSVQMPFDDLTQYLNSKGLQGKRIGIVSNYASPHPKVNTLFRQAVDAMRNAGAVIIDNVVIKTKGEWRTAQLNALLWDFKDEIADYLKTTDMPFNTLAELIALNNKHAAEELTTFGQEIFIMAEATQGKQTQHYRQERQTLLDLARKKGIDAALKQHNLDILIAPTTQPAWKIDRVNGDYFSGSASSPAAIAGYPHISVPMGFVLHLPVGISFFSTANSEPILIEAAYHFEQITQARRAPSLRANGTP